ncbi:uncharacterized protein LOC116612999 isoform X1 [Nematostella vectensis]|uniref:uncharacterized protein LOC116612999 isoform X1 n=1 Tax=Nematostella vectensis TaxID=45351 RepID=UPI002076F276|nr:uncharacterized protein LOC116612999 isoform X1 [Nematostella vectensis]
MTSASRRLEDEVTCSICIEHFNDPRVLPCLHSFCRHCLEELAVHSEGRGKLVCPLCKAEFQISPADVPSLKVNFMINSIISVLPLLTSEDSKKKPSCESCDSGEPAQGRCNECDHFVCEQCISAHKRLRLLQHHTLLSLDEIKSGKLLSKSKTSYCTKHEGEVLKLFCESCKEVICRDCTVVDHKNHDYLFTSDVIAREKEEILGRAKKVASKLTDIEQAMALVEETQQHLEENKRATRRDLDAFIDKQIGTLEKMRSDLKGGIESACQKHDKQLTAQRETLSMRLASARSSLEFAERMCRDANDVDVLSIRNEVLSQLSSLAEKPVDQPCTEVGVRLVVDEEYWDSLSKKISVDVISVGESEQTGLEQSAILSGKGPEYLRDLLGFLKPMQQSPKSRWVRCFSAKRDGWAARTFHEKCNGKAPNIVLVSVGGRYVFGGYSDVAWTKMTSASRRLEDEVTCSICIEHFNDPRVLPCLHSFCRHCLEELAVHSEGRGKLVCPLCKAEFQISPADVPSLKVNFMINSIISVLPLLTSEDSKKKPSCESCDSGEPAQGRCNECDHFVCEQCISAHKRLRLLQHHTLLSLDEIKSGKLLSKSKTSYCTKHEGEVLKLFCESCKEVICRDCTVVDHKNHDYLFTSDVIAREKEEILGRAKKVASKLTDIEQAMALVEETQQHLEENKRATRRDLDAFIDKQIGTLEKMRSDLKGGIESACQKHDKQLTAQRETLSMRLASARSSLEFAERMCRDANDVDVLSIRNEVLSQLSSLAEKPVDQPCTEVGVRLVVDEEYWDSLSKKISVDVISVGESEQTGLEQSAILSGKGPEYLRDLLGILKPVQQSPKSRWVRCFSAKRDGWAARTFHEKCDGKAPNIVLVSVEGRYVFGGYSDVAWTMSDRGWQSSSKSFLLTLCNKNGYRPEKLPLRRTPDRYAICDDTRHGPVFGVDPVFGVPSFGGCSDLFIADNAGGNEESYTRSHTYARPQGVTSDGSCDVFADKYRFTPDEMEVFHEVVD